MTFIAVFTRAPDGGYTAMVEEIPGAISEGESIDEARENLADALRMVLECNREIARQHEPASAISWTSGRTTSGCSTCRACVAGRWFSKRRAIHGHAFTPVAASLEDGGEGSVR